MGWGWGWQKESDPLPSETAFQRQAPPGSGVSAPVCSSPGSPSLGYPRLPGQDNGQANSTGVSHPPHTGKVS